MTTDISPDPAADFVPSPLPACAEPCHVPADLVPAALAFAPPGTMTPDDVDRDVRCMLQAHTAGDHYALVMDLPGRDTGSVWTRWNHNHPARPVRPTLVALPDCPGTPTAPCCAFTGHPGAHTTALAEPWPPRR